MLPKSDLSKIIELNSSILKLLPKNDSMHDMYFKMDKRLKERFDLYDKFIKNPYKDASRSFKLNSDKELGLGEYLSPED
jgi:hypothetical protein